MYIFELNSYQVTVLATATSAFATVILVVITAYYAWETYKIRVGSIKPSFSLVTEQYYVSKGLKLKNTGGVARDVKVDVVTNNGESKLFVSSFNTGHEIDIDMNSDINFEEIKKDKGSINVVLKYKDGYDQNQIDLLTYDFTQLTDENRKIVVSSSQKEKYLEIGAVSLHNKLDEIVRALYSIEKTLDTSKPKNKS